MSCSHVIASVWMVNQCISYHVMVHPEVFCESTEITGDKKCPPRLAVSNAFWFQWNPLSGGATNIGLIFDPVVFVKGMKRISASRKRTFSGCNRQRVGMKKTTVLAKHEYMYLRKKQCPVLHLSYNEHLFVVTVVSHRDSGNGYCEIKWHT